MEDMNGDLCENVEEDGPAVGGVQNFINSKVKDNAVLENKNQALRSSLDQVSKDLQSSNMDRMDIISWQRMGPELHVGDPTPADKSQSLATEKVDLGKRPNDAEYAIPAYKKRLRSSSGNGTGKTRVI